MEFLLKTGRMGRAGEAEASGGWAVEKTVAVLRNSRPLWRDRRLAKVLGVGIETARSVLPSCIGPCRWRRGDRAFADLGKQPRKQHGHTISGV
ncbi:MAG: hypothetical protein ABIO45_17840 [Burkholderiaceae bacterium]